MIRRIHFAPAPQTVASDPAPTITLHDCLRKLERLTATPKRPSDFLDLKQEILSNMRRLAAAARQRGSRQFKRRRSVDA